MSGFLFTKGALSDDHYKAIGQFVAEFATLEWVLGEHICNMTNLNPTHGNIIVSRLNLRDLLEIAQNLIYHRFGDSPEKETFSKIILGIRNAAPIRNKIIHGQWHESDEPGIVHHWDFHGSKRIEVKVRPIEDTEIFGWAEQIAKITLALTMFYDEHLAERPPLPDKP